MDKIILPFTAAHLTNQIDNVLFYSFPSLDDIKFVRHGFSSRFGGVSKYPYSNMNLGFTRGDKEENVTENYHRICKALGLESENLVISSQEHNTNILKVTSKDKGKGFSVPRDFTNIDGLLTNEPNITLSTLYADCVPLFFVDPVKQAVGVAHSGWKGTVKMIGKVMVERFTAEFASNPSDLLVGVGPSIGPCCFEVGQEVYDEFANMDCLEIKKVSKPSSTNEVGKHMIDLWEVNRQILLSAGVSEENISITDLCTKCNHDIFWSHRVEGNNRGSSAAIIGMVSA